MDSTIENDSSPMYMYITCMGTVYSIVSSENMIWRGVVLSPSRKRDKARLEMNTIFKDVIQKRRDNQHEEYEDDILNTLMHGTYK